jgi:D-alanine-D-alanine ligase
MDKAVTKMILEKYGIKQTEWMLFYKKEYLGDPEAALRFCQEKLSYPVFVKPANAGSSKGISKVCNQEELKVAFDTAYLYDEKVLVEKAVAGREIEIGLLEKDGEILTSCCGEIRTKAAFYDYNAKYHDDSVELVIPADIDPVIQNTIAKIAKKIFRALDCEGFSRADFFLSGNHILFNEINAIPGFTSVSMYPKMFEKSGISYAELIDTMVNRACKK